MTRAARRYDIYLPLTLNDGQRVPGRHFHEVETQLLAQFVGITVQQPDFPFRGAWRADNQIYYDRVIVMTVLDFRKKGSTRFIADLKQEFLVRFQQLEILITETSLRVH